MRLCCLVLMCLLVISPSESSELIDAAKMGRRDYVQSLIAQGADISKTDENGMTALMWAATQSRLDIVALVDEGYQAACRKRTAKSSMWRSESIYGEIERILLEADANAYADTAKVQDRKNRALIQAITKGNPTEVRAQLRNGADPNTIDRERPILTWAAFWGQEDIAKILLDAGADARIRDANGFSALMLAEERGHESRSLMLKGHGQPLP